MRVFTGQCLQLLVPAPELKAAVVEASDLGLQLLNLRLEPPGRVGQALNGTLLLIRVRRAIKSLLTEGLREQLKERVRPAPAGLIDLPVHGIGQLAGHRLRT